MTARGRIVTMGSTGVKSPDKPYAAFYTQNSNVDLPVLQVIISVESAHDNYAFLA